MSKEDKTVDTGADTHVDGNDESGGGDFVGGDSLAVGDVSDSIVAIGRGAQVTVIHQHTEPPPDLSSFANDPLNVFVSSDKGLVAEREAAVRAIESLKGLSRPWLVELTASSRRRQDLAADYVRRCDIFVMLFEDDISGYLEAEQGLAIRSGIANRLYFAKLAEDRALDSSLLDYLRANVVQFSTPEELEDLIKRALVDTLIEGVRNQNRQGLVRGDLDILYRLGQALGIGAGLLDVLVQARSTPAITSVSSSEEPSDQTSQERMPAHAQEKDPAQPRPAPREPHLPDPAGELVIATPQNIQRLLSRPNPPKRIWWEKAGMELCLVPAGEFLAGLRDEDVQTLLRHGGEIWRYEGQTPRRTAYLEAYYIGRYPVTQAQYARFVQATGRDVPHVDQDWARPYNWNRIYRAPPGGKEEHPVVRVSGDDVRAYCRWAGLRLPSEAEWEKAARGTDGRLYPWGDDPPDRWRCNYGQNVGETTPCGKYSLQGDSPNGCADMAGNVWERTVDADGSFASWRGGSWWSDAAAGGCAARFYLPLISDYYSGFRVVSPISLS